MSVEEQCKAAYDAFLAAVPQKPVESKQSKKPSGSTIVSALHSAAGG